MTKPETETDPKVDTRPSNFASRKREREAREAVEGIPPRASHSGIPGGIDAVGMSVVINRVS